MLLDKHYLIPQSNGEDRSLVAAKYISKYRYIFDLGCGVKDLKKYISKDQFYTGIDFRPVDDTVHFCDFNESFPIIHLGKKSDRCGVVLGVLEYLDNVEKFLYNCKENFNQTIMSYLLTKDPCEAMKPFYLLTISKIEEIVNRVFCNLESITLAAHKIYIGR
jgi:hypothetical protein